MNREKKLINKIFILIMIFILVASMSITSFADYFKGDSGAYCTVEKQQEIYKLLKKNDDIKKKVINSGYNILIESIAPEYYINIYNYAESGQLEVLRLCKWKSETEMDGTLPLYNAKLISDDNEFCGVVEFYVGDKSVEISSIDIVNNQTSTNKKTTSKSYADYAEYIKKSLNLDDFVQSKNVQYVKIEGISNTSFFLVSKGDEQYLFPIDIALSNKSITYKSYIDIGNGNFMLVANDAIGKYAEWKKEYDTAKQECEQTNPDEPFVFEGDGSITVELASPEFNNVINISNYLSTGIDEPSSVGKYDGKLSTTSIIIALVVAFIVLITIAIIIIKKVNKN